MLTVAGCSGCSSGQQPMPEGQPSVQPLQVSVPRPIGKEYGHSPDAPSPRGYVPLRMAVIRGNPRFVPMLLKHGADPNHWDRFGGRALHEAVHRNDQRSTELLIRRQESTGLETVTCVTYRSSQDRDRSSHSAGPTKRSRGRYAGLPGLSDGGSRGAAG